MDNEQPIFVPTLPPEQQKRAEELLREMGIPEAEWDSYTEAVLGMLQIAFRVFEEAQREQA